MNTMNNKKTLIRIGDVIYSVFEGKWIILALAVVGLLVGILVSGVGYVQGEMSKQYKIEASILISSQINDGTFSTSNPNPTRDDISLAKEITDQAMYIIRSEKNISTAIEKLGMVGVSAKSIKNNLSLARYTDTQIVELSFLWRSKEEGVNILKALEEACNETMQSTMKVGRIVSVNEPTAAYIFGGQFDIAMWIYFALAGFVLGFGVCILRRMLRPTLILPEDLEELYDTELIESIRFDPAFAKSDPFTIIPESVDTEIASAAYILLNKLEDKNIKRFYVTSAGRKEGRTTLLADIAVKLSEAQKKVLVVDCDFHNPTLAPLFQLDLKYENSLNALYSGDSDISDAIVRLSGGLHLLPYRLENRPDPLSGPMLHVIDAAAKNYDLVLIDAPPAGENAEALRLNEIADAALFIARFDGPSLPEIETALNRLQKSGIPVIGAIVNGTKNLRTVFLEKRKHTLGRRRGKARADKTKKAAAKEKKTK